MTRQPFHPLVPYEHIFVHWIAAARSRVCAAADCSQSSVTHSEQSSHELSMSTPHMCDHLTEERLSHELSMHESAARV